MSAPRIHPQHVRDAAIADYLRSDDSVEVVAKRHGLGRSTLNTWVSGMRDDLEYRGGWFNDRGIMRPLEPTRESA